jgi:hypothetical protein
VEVADILHAQGGPFVEQHPWLSVQQRSVLRAIVRCRTAALGGHVDACGACGHQAISYNVSESALPEVSGAGAGALAPRP